jgi:histone H3/H4
MMRAKAPLAKTILSDKQKKQQKLHRERKIQEEEAQLQRQETTIIGKCSFARMVREVFVAVCDNDKAFSGIKHVSANAISGLQQIAEEYITDVFADGAATLNMYNKRTLYPEQVHKTLSQYEFKRCLTPAFVSQLAFKRKSEAFVLYEESTNPNKEAMRKYKDGHITDEDDIFDVDTKPRSKKRVRFNKKLNKKHRYYKEEDYVNPTNNDTKIETREEIQPIQQEVKVKEEQPVEVEKVQTYNSIKYEPLSPPHHPEVKNEEEHSTKYYDTKEEIDDDGAQPLTPKSPPEPTSLFASEFDDFFEE